MDFKQQVHLLQERYGYSSEKCYCPQNKAVIGYCAFCGVPVCDECHDGTFCRTCITDPPRKKSTALLLAVFLGWLGVHRFYMKFYITGVIYLLTLGLFGIGWAIDVIRILFFSTINYMGPKYSFGEDLSAVLGDTIMERASDNVRWFIERRFWRDKYGRPLIPLGYKLLEAEEKAQG
jgi:TM2 domain-containing membrane protein YozV